MKNETVVTIFAVGLFSLLVGIFLASPLFVGMWMPSHMGWNQTYNRNQQNIMGGSMMGDNMDRHFIEQMIPHHEDAILMADIALTKAEHEEIKQLSRDIKKSQSAEIVQMTSWYKLWYGAAVPESSSMMGGGMGGGMMNMGTMGDATDVETLKNAEPFDKEFIEQMIPHHQMAIMMATMLLRGTNREEMKTLGQNIIDAQSREISQMRLWHKAWYGR